MILLLDQNPYTLISYKAGSIFSAGIIMYL